MFVKMALGDKENKDGRLVRCYISSYEDMLRLEYDNGQPVRFILLSGIAGSGKTTIVSKIATDWALQKPGSPLSKFSLLVALSVREMKRAPDFGEAIFDQILAKDTVVRQTSLENHLKSHPQEVLVVLDGADEFDKEGFQLPTEGDIMDIIGNKILRGCTVIVTTRPHMVDKLCKLNPSFTRVETSGFSDSGVREYVQKFFKGEDPKNSAELCSILMATKSLKNLARSPMMLLLICLIWSGEHSLPDTLTELFQEAVMFMLKRYFVTTDHPCQGDEELYSKEVLQLVQDLGKTALDGLMLPGQKLIFEASEFGHSKKVVKSCKIGVLSQEKVRSKLRVVQHVTFFHKTFQEAIAGFYWASLFESDQGSFKRYLGQVNEKNVIGLEYLLRFCCGVNVNAAESLLKHVVGQGSMEKLGTLLLRLHLEAQSKTLHGIMAPIFKNGLFFDLKWGGDIRLGFEFLIKCSCQPSVSQSCLSEVKNVTILRVNKNVPLVVDVLRHAENVTDVLLDFRPAASVDTSLLFALGDAMCRSTFLSNISLVGKLNLSAMFKPMVELPPASFLQGFFLRGPMIDSRLLKRFIQKQDKLCQISLCNENISERDCTCEVDEAVGNEEAADVSSGDHQMQPLQKFTVRYYKSQFLAGCFFGWSCPHLQVLELVGVNLHEGDFHRVSVFLSRARQLQVVDLSENRIGGAFLRLAEQFIALQCLEVLILKDVGMLPDDVCHFARGTLPQLANLRILSIARNSALTAKALLSVIQGSRHSSSLKELSIHSCVKEEPEEELSQISDSDVEDAFPMVEETQLKYQGSLEILSLRNNNLGKSSSKVIRLLKEMSCLKSLDMMDLPLTDSDLIFFAEVLPCCQQLEELFLSRKDKFGNVGMEALLKILPDLPQLKHMELPAYEDNEGTDFIRECLKHRFPYSSECLFDLPDITKVKQTVQKCSVKT
ncbi:NACHT, LRR and PYD domains-containing protein 3-like isoform X2 [Acanthaster planci]|nr:NACHT, LRR and PYD domains-containing protein 3-like isoform X2 [Acanthaster planci]